MGNSIWAIWYNLEDEDRSTFQNWLHQSYLPAIASNSHFDWIAHFQRIEAPPQSARKADGSFVIGHTKDEIGQGQEYILIIGASSSTPFLDPLFLSEENQSVPGTKEFLALRRGVRHVMFMEQQCVDGAAPEAAAHPPYPGPVIQFGSYRLQSVDNEFEVATWYELCRLKFMALAPQCVRTRTYAGVAGWAKHGVLYEFTSIAARNECWDIQRRMRNTGELGQSWEIGHFTQHTPGSPVVCERTFAAICAPPVK